MTKCTRDRRRDGSRVFTIPAGVPFLSTFVAALLDGSLVPGFSASAGPLGLAEATIYVPTRRAARALAAAFAERIGAPGTFLPRILPLGDYDAIETDVVLDGFRTGGQDGALLQPAIDPMARRMILTRLVLRWAASVRHAVRAEAGADSSEPFVVAGTAADAWHLAGELATLLDEMILAGLDARTLAPLGTDTFDRYWAITLDFLKIATDHWPAILAERGEVDGAAREMRLMEAELARMARARGPCGPVLVAGVVGSEPLTLRLVAAVAKLAQGAVVLPGLDQNLDEASWRELGLPGRGDGHPQAALLQMLAAMSVSRAGILPLGALDAELAARARLISEALRPAETTEAWIGAAELDRAAALRRVSVIEASDEREEALALAIGLREALDGPGSAVLVTPDRSLARRVREELVRWGIEIDDSGGEPLSGTPAGALAQLALDGVVDDLDAGAVLALLAHPGVRLGRSRRNVEHLSRRAELVLLRGVLPKGVLSDPTAWISKVRAAARAENAAPVLRHVRDEDFDALESLLADLVGALAPLRSLQAGTELAGWVAAHEAVVAELTRTDADGTALAGVDGARLATLFDELAAHAEPGLTLDRRDYAALYRRIARETTVRGPARSHPRLKILGLLEFRLLGADRVLLGGLDEGIWPPQVTSDAFLNRPMRAALGLAPPERRLGQSTHDFEMAFGQAEVIVSRAAKRGGAPTVPSRILQRLAAVAGEDHWTACKARGRRYLGYARALDQPDRPIVIRRPSPKPPVDLRPTHLSVTRVETLRRDPYAIYADKILRLRPLEPVGAEIGPREWGTAFHDVLRSFVDKVRNGPVPAEALQELLRESRAVFAPLMTEPHTRAFLAPRLERWVHGFHAWHTARRGGLAGLHVEQKGTLTIPLRDGSTFELEATADRIEHNEAGGLRLVDYKTGAAPTTKEVAAGFAPQLTLEAAIALGGGFAALDAVTSVDEALYVRFGTERTPTETPLTWQDRTLAEVVAEHLDGLTELLNGFRDPGVGYMARPYPQFVGRYGDYDHLSRVKEWSATGGLADGSEDEAA